MSDISGVGEDAYGGYMSMNPYSDSFNPTQAIPEQAQLPGIMGMMTSPGFEQFTKATNPVLLGGYGAFRSQNTLMYGGIGDDVGRFRQALRRGKGKFSNYSRGSLVPDVTRGPNQFVGGTNIFGRPTRRGQRLLAKQLAVDPATGAMGGKMSMFKSFRKNNLSLDPRRFFRKHGLSEYLAGPGRNYYAPNQGGFLATIGNIGAKKDNPRFSGGMLGRMGALAKTERRVARRGAGAAAKMDLNLARIGYFNAPAGSLASTVRTGVVAANISPHAGRAFSGIVAPTTVQTASAISTTPTALGSLVNKAAAGDALTIGERRYLMTQGIRGRYSKTLMTGMLTSGGGTEMITGLGSAGMKTFGSGSIKMTETAERLIRPMATALAKDGGANRAMNMALSRGINPQMHLLNPVNISPHAGRAFANLVAPTTVNDVVGHRAGLMATEIAEKGLIKTFGAKGAAKFAMETGSARVGLAVAGEAALAAVPGLNLIFAADMAYQLAKLGGMAVKGAINFGKDAMKSMQGNINGGMFGTYKDDEVRATSRARGVMAIQNSRLNARSLLGSEGAMMAAHFG